MNKISIGNHVTPYLLLACVLLGVILAIESHNMIQSQNDNAPEAQTVVDTVDPDSFIPPGIQAFSEIMERPLFVAGREPPPEPKAAPVAEARLSPLRLLLEGVAITPSAEIAVVRDPSNNRILHLENGMKHQGWELTSITSTGVKFRQGEQTHELTLTPEVNTRRR